MLSLVLTHISLSLNNRCHNGWETQCRFEFRDSFGYLTLYKFRLSKLLSRPDSTQSKFPQGNITNIQFIQYQFSSYVQLYLKDSVSCWVTK